MKTEEFHGKSKHRRVGNWIFYHTKRSVNFLARFLEELNLENVWLTHWIKSFSSEEFLGNLNRTSVTWDFLAQNGQSQVSGRFWGRWLPDLSVETLGRLEFGSHSSSLAGIEASHSKWSTCWALQSYAFSCMCRLKKENSVSVCPFKIKLTSNYDKPFIFQCLCSTLSDSIITRVMRVATKTVLATQSRCSVIELFWNFSLNLFFF